MARSGRGLKYILIIKEPIGDRQNTVPRVLDISIVTPQVTDLTQQSVIHLKNTTICDVSLALKLRMTHKAARDISEHNACYQNT